MRRRAKTLAALCAVSALSAGDALAGAMSANNFMIPSKDVVLVCAPLRYRTHCSISLRANPQYSSYCFYVSSDQSYPMKTDYRFGFYNEIVSIQVHDGLRIFGELRELRTGARARCHQAG